MCIPLQRSANGGQERLGGLFKFYDAMRLEPCASPKL
jgi:hypothetical protein